MAVYGRIISVKHFEIHDGPGVRTTLFLKGCPLRCAWCHNPESMSQAVQLMYTESRCILCSACTCVCHCHQFVGGRHMLKREKCTVCGKCTLECQTEALQIMGRSVKADDILPELLEDRIFFGDKGGVTLSGGEPLLQADFSQEVLKKVKEAGVSTAVDSCCYAQWEAFEKVLPYTDLFLADIKAVDEAAHVRCTGVSNRLILDNIRKLDALGIPLEIRIPYIPGVNSDQMEKAAKFICTLRSVTAVKLLPYHDYGRSRYQALGMTYPAEAVPVPSPDEIQGVLQNMRALGVSAVNGAV